MVFADGLQLKTEAFLIVVAVVASLLFLLVDFYILVFYSHRDEPAFSVVSIFCKVLIVITLLQTQFQPFFLVLDVANSRGNDSDLTTLWLALYLSLLVNLAFLKPIATSLYQRDHEDPCWKVTLWTAFEIAVSLGVFGLFFGVGWAFWGDIAMPVELVEVDAHNFSVAKSAEGAVISELHLHFSSSVICFVVAFFCLIGYTILACCGACGLTALPISLILEFVNRPKFRRTADAKKVGDFLKVETVRLLREEEKLKRSLSRVSSAEGFFERRGVTRKFEEELKAIESELQTHKDYYDLFKMQLQMQDVNPIVFWLKLIGGMFSIILSTLIWVQILLAQLVFPQASGHPSIFLDSMLNFLEDQNANFMAVALVMVVAIYLSLSIIKGSVFFSHSLPFLTIHPILEGKTWLNSFLFHLTLCSFAAASLLHLLTSTFPYYLRGGSISVVLNLLLTNMTVLGFLLNKNVFTYCFLIIGILGMVYVSFKMLCGGEAKGELLKRIEAKRLKLFGKDGQNKSLKFIEMTEMKEKTSMMLLPAQSAKGIKYKGK